MGVMKVSEPTGRQLMGLDPREQTQLAESPADNETTGIPAETLEQTEETAKPAPASAETEAEQPTGRQLMGLDPR